MLCPNCRRGDWGLKKRSQVPRSGTEDNAIILVVDHQLISYFLRAQGWAIRMGRRDLTKGRSEVYYSQSYPTCKLDPLRQRWKPLPVVNVSEVWVPQPAADMQLPSSKNKTPEISHIILLELWTHISISSPEIRSRKRRRFKEDGKEERNCKYSRQQITNERKLKGKGRLNKERSFRHKDNKRRK